MHRPQEGHVGLCWPDMKGCELFEDAWERLRRESLWLTVNAGIPVKIAASMVGHVDQEWSGAVALFQITVSLSLLMPVTQRYLEVYQLWIATRIVERSGLVAGGWQVLHDPQGCWISMFKTQGRVRGFVHLRFGTGPEFRRPVGQAGYAVSACD